ncbi:hypothetical protein BpHYR1_025472 [Brachionus plicatilis]|uniref:Uncharacterized protein n=1 Tax=Brachionus plicatilis TaxID=10195 RepID=A0A3M7Q2N9_BRAPC|nr:hypothetical protein BpHYR1_025472 [Brachionus plicatilis]
MIEVVGQAEFAGVVHLLPIVVVLDRWIGAGGQQVLDGGDGAGVEHGVEERRERPVVGDVSVGAQVQQGLDRLVVADEGGTVHRLEVGAAVVQRHDGRLGLAEADCHAKRRFAEICVKVGVKAFVEETRNLVRLVGAYQIGEFFAVSLGVQRL